MSCSNSSIIVLSPTKPAAQQATQPQQQKKRAQKTDTRQQATQHQRRARRDESVCDSLRAVSRTASLHLLANLLRQRRRRFLQQIAQQVARRDEIEIEIARQPFALRALAASLSSPSSRTEKRDAAKRRSNEGAHVAQTRARTHTGKPSNTTRSLLILLFCVGRPNSFSTRSLECRFAALGQSAGTNNDSRAHQNRREKS